ncbi:nucleotide-binding alpha-beta plait domain-containing protein [Tanacetum coccineum]|uniref:Nucleotide-binding alpha-beta plait domain-containing protein n=1 Tax=Tanacetum coccineum TaxID=301880 RepID=A0ABQ5D8K6_9ASTR
MTYNSAILYLVLQQLAQYGIEHIEMIRVPEDIAYNKMVKVGDTKSKNKIKGFAFLEFSMHSVAAVTYQRLKKPDVVLGRDVSAKVSFEQSAKPSNDEDVPQVNRVHMAGLAKDWDEEKLEEICEKYGEIVNIDLHQSSNPKHKDFGFTVKVNPPRVLLMYGYIRNHKKTIKNKQTRTRESEERKRSQGLKAKANKSQP